MESLKSVVVASVLVFLCCSLRLVCGDLAADRQECMPSLTGLAPCLGFVQGSGGSTPNPDCCKSMQQLLDTNRKCLCVLIKDKDQANLPINTNLALQLPSLCHRTVNITHCIDLLKLPVNSPDANLFKQLANSTATAPPSPSSGSAAAVSGSGSSKRGRNEPSGGRVVGECVVLLWGWFLMLVTLSIWS